MRPLSGLAPVLAGGFCLAVSLFSQSALAESIAQATAGLKAQPGFVDLYRNTAKGKALIAIHEFDQPFLLLSSLPYGLGSNDVGLDRGQQGEPKIVEFRRVGNRVLLVQPNNRFIASADNAAERLSARQAFAESVLWAGDVIAEDSAAKKPAVLVDFSDFLLADQHGVADSLERSKQGDYQVDDKRSLVMLGDSFSFPDNTELEALLTFAGPGKGGYVRDVAMDPKALSLRQHLSLVRLPEGGFKARPYHPASGGFSVGHTDFSAPLSASTDVRYQVRFRLEKTDPTAALSPVKKPIVYYLDPGTPEPVRSALMEGAGWWAKAFEKAGFKDAFQVKLLPEGANPMDIRYNVIEWVHRATRGWSYGSFIADPRDGEILKGAVTLGSQRVRQDLLIAESLLAPYGKANEAELKQAAEAMALARLRQLAAHEVGHTLGFAHNFAASRNGNGSVMDYPHPLLNVDANGQLDLSAAYGVGVGPWDEFIVKHAYAQFPASEEAAGLASLRAEAAKAGLEYVSDRDSRSPGASHPDGLLWDFGPDALSSFDKLMAVRKTALARFSPAVLPPDRQLGELEARLVPVYLLHRYQSEAVARLLGGASYRYGLVGDTPAGTTVAPADTQKAALLRLVSTLTAENLALPASVLDILTPPGADYEHSREYFISKSAPVFDAIAAVEAAAAQSCQFLFDRARLNRLAWQHARDAEQPGIDEVMETLFDATWQHDRFPKDLVAGDSVQLAANWVVLDAAMAASQDEDLHPAVAAELKSALETWQHWLEKHPGEGVNTASRKAAAEHIARFLAAPAKMKLPELPAIPPGSPI